jgi:hypothetical protein
MLLQHYTYVGTDPLLPPGHDSLTLSYLYLYLYLSVKNKLFFVVSSLKVDQIYVV